METKSSSGKNLERPNRKKLYRCTHRELDIYRRTHFSAFRPFFLFPLLDNQCVVRKLNVYDYGIRWTTQCDFSCLATEDLLIYLNTLQENLREILYHRFRIYLFLIKILYSINNLCLLLPKPYFAQFCLHQEKLGLQRYIDTKCLLKTQSKVQEIAKERNRNERWMMVKQTATQRTLGTLMICHYV